MDFETQDGFLVMNDLPHDCIFNKVKTGCGATTIAIKKGAMQFTFIPEGPTSLARAFVNPITAAFVAE